MDEYKKYIISFINEDKSEIYDAMCVFESLFISLYQCLIEWTAKKYVSISLAYSIKDLSYKIKNVQFLYNIKEPNIDDLLIYYNKALSNLNLNIDSIPQYKELINYNIIDKDYQYKYLYNNCLEKTQKELEMIF